SKALATIRRDLSVPLELDALDYPGPDVERMRPLFAELEFLSLLRELAPVAAAPAVEQRPIGNPVEARGAAAELGAAGAVALVAAPDSPRATAAGPRPAALPAPGR